LLGFNYKIVYKKGLDNRAANALSRRPHDLVQCSAISIVLPKWLEEIQATYEGDSYAQGVIAKLIIDDCWS
jgi:hypothetical protein